MWASSADSNGAFDPNQLQNRTFSLQFLREAVFNNSIRAVALTSQSPATETGRALRSLKSEFAASSFRVIGPILRFQIAWHLCRALSSLRSPRPHTNRTFPHKIGGRPKPDPSAAAACNSHFVPAVRFSTRRQGERPCEPPRSAYKALHGGNTLKV